MSQENDKIETFSEPNDSKILEDVELYKEFISESCEHLQDTEANILTLEDNPHDEEILNGIFRCVHSIKGSAGFLGLEKMQKLSHELETLLDKARKFELDITPRITDVLLNSIDTLGKLIDSLAIRTSTVSGTECERMGKSVTGEEIDIGSSLESIAAILDSEQENSDTNQTQNETTPSKETSNTTETSDTSETTENDKETVNTANIDEFSQHLKDIVYTNEPQGEMLGDILVKDGAVTEDELNEAVTIKNKKLGQILVEKGTVSPEQLNDAINIKNKKIGEILVENCHIPEEKINEAVKLKEKRLGEILVEKGSTSKKKVDEAIKKQNVTKETVKTMLKVDTDKLDSLFDLVGELVVTHSLIEEQFVGGENQNNDASRNLSQLGKIVKDLQDQSMSLRMVPLKQTFQKMSRLVRDIGSSLGKNIKFEVSGEDTELDKTVIEKVADPLVHILRNAVDHGIESNEDRLKANKLKEGHVLLAAFHRGGNIIIEIKDDGKGLSKERILNKAIEKGIISDPASLSDEQIFNLIFAPGFSTAEKITNVSGRGVGMDVVKRNIENLQGKVEIASEEGKGSVFTIKLPLTLAIIDGIVIRVGNTRYILPIISVEESIQPDKEVLSTIRQKEEVLNIRGEVIPLVRLNKLFMIDGKKDNPWEAIVVIIQAENTKLGLMADDLIGQQQVVIKSLGKRFKMCKGISGAAIMGNGEVGLIMDVNGIKELAFNN